MALIRTGQGITDIRGGLGGVYFSRDKSGLHILPKPRRVSQRTTAQNKQRNAFTKARSFSTNNRVVSYNIYRALTGLPFLFDITATGNPTPDCTGIYILGGEEFGANWYHRADNAFFLWAKVPPSIWAISTVRGVYGANYWYTTEGLLSKYNPYGGAVGIVTISQELRPPPVDYTISKL